MKVKYLYQQLGSHISVILISIVILSMIFSQFIERYVYENKIDEITSYGQHILQDLERHPNETQQILRQYGNVMMSRDILYSLFDEKANIIYSAGRFMPTVEITNGEWQQIKNGQAVNIKQEFRRFEEGVTFVLLPYHHQQQFVGGILLISPIEGSREVISKINQYLFYTVLIALAVALLLSWIVSTFHVSRIKRIRKATSMVAEGHYNLHLPASDFDEIGELAQDFNQMVEQLQLSMEEIKNLENRRRQFMADVSHELRTPLTTISGIIEGLRNEMIPEADQEKALRLASKETRRLIRLVNENLDYEKIRSNQVKLHLEQIHLQEMMEIIKDQLDGMAAHKNNQIHVEVDQNVYIYADYDRLTQILINITKNSIQFTENGHIYLRGRQDEKNTTIMIKDTGIGMDTKEIEKIWDRFYKAMVSRTNNPYGEFGLGLSIVKQLVHLHKGNIAVESQEGKGTIFTIKIPLKPD